MPYEQNITHSYIIDFIRESLSASGGILKELEDFAKDTGVPIASAEVASLLKVLCLIFKPSRVLEVGSAIGYSAILMAHSLPSDAKITTIERDADMARMARQNIHAAGFSDRIELLEADAEPLLSVLDGEYDMIFLDAAKAHYIHFLPDCIRLLRPGGLLISDNVLYGGMVASRSLLNRRKITIVKRLKKYIHAICHTPQLISTIIPIGDGVALSYKK